MTLDTSCVIHAVHDQSQAGDVERLIDAAIKARVTLWLTAAFAADQALASSDHLHANLAWLAERPVNQAIPGPFRLDYSALDGPDVLIDESTSVAIGIIEKVLLPKRYRPGQIDGEDQQLMKRWRRKLHDVQHLAAHHMAGHDAFVTTDVDDMIKKRDELWKRASIRVVTPAEALALLDS